jgi:hypothetical protein
MADLRSIKPIKEVVADVVSDDVDAVAKEAKDARATGFLFIFQSGDRLVMRARINGVEVYKFIGFIETDVKSTLVALMKGDD